MSSPGSHDNKLLASLAATPLEDAIQSDLLTSALSKPPFITLPGALNLRDIGAFVPGHVASGKVFRSGTLDFMPAPLRPSLRSKLGVSRVYDFRRDDEAKGGRLEIDGVRVISCPYKNGMEKPLPIVISDFAPSGDSAVGEGYRKMYDNILDGYTTGFRLVFEGLCSTGEGEAVLFHCTAGKDRTGVMSALILNLMGVPAELIGLEYALTRIGTEPFREKLLPVALRSYGSAPAAAAVATEGNVDKKEGPGGVDLSSPGLRELLSTNAAVMVDFVDHLQRKHNGAQGYMMGPLGFSEAEVGLIRDRLKPGGQRKAA